MNLKYPKMYYPQLVPIIGSINAALLFAQMEFWFEKSKGESFFKFSAPNENAKYKVGDSWQEELGFTRNDFEGARNLICTNYKSKSDFDRTIDKFMGKPYCCYKDRISHLTYYFRNQNIVETIIKNSSVMLHHDITVMKNYSITVMQQPNTTVMQESNITDEFNLIVTKNTTETIQQKEEEVENVSVPLFSGMVVDESNADFFDEFEEAHGQAKAKNKQPQTAKERAIEQNIQAKKERDAAAAQTAFKPETIKAEITPNETNKILERHKKFVADTFNEKIRYTEKDYTAAEQIVVLIKDHIEFLKEKGTQNPFPTESEWVYSIFDKMMTDWRKLDDFWRQFYRLPSIALKFSDIRLALNPPKPKPKIQVV